MFKEFNGEILHGTEETGYTHYGFIEDVHIEESENLRIYKRVKFNFDKNKYEIDEDNIAPITIDGVEHIPINGIVKIDISEENRQKALASLKSKYLKLIKDADLLGDIEEKTRLQQEYLQKKTEIENA
ncbi:hypothetical protein FQB35_04630 [Crassaminicella thermophila]|uniref:Uncharacterized protein n=1 Tax=Crassaminicella thermophila TaxID=2599308 RepID=A0A5C0SEI4_CRATE|nr:hypothetical protein [Crassaminicella thermophila]QEK11704.1 hypothetical protein FQB35_04630 [Crassaminicella thermophila]